MEDTIMITIPLSMYDNHIRLEEYYRLKMVEAEEKLKKLEKEVNTYDLFVGGRKDGTICRT